MVRPPPSHDAVVVGGGHNGLVAAAYLARAGLSCLVLERRGAPGGAAVSEQVFAGVDARLSRYAYLVSLLPGQIADELGLDLRLERRRIGSYTPDPACGCTRGLLLPADGGGEALERLRSFRHLTEAAARVLFPTMLEPLLPREEVAARVGEEAWELLFERPIGEGVADRLGEDLLAGAVLTDALIGTFASAADRSLVQNRCFLYHTIGRGSGEWLVPVGGMGRVSGALDDAARAAGAELLTGAEVLAIDPGGDRVKVLYTQGGARREVSAPRVLVNAAPAVLERLLGGRGADAPPEGSQLKVNMLLSRLPRLKDPRVDPRDAFAGTFHVNEGAAQLQAAFEQAAAGSNPRPRAVRGLLPLAHGPEHPRSRAAGARGADLDGVRAAHARTAVHG